MQVVSAYSSSDFQQGNSKEETYLSAKYISADKRFTILSLDGGGVRGGASILALQEICKRALMQPYEFVDEVIGTSTGGLIGAACLGKKNDQPLFKISDLFSFWNEKIGQVFHHKCKWWLPHSDGIFWVKYSDDGLQKVLQEIADDSMDIQSNMFCPAIFTSFDATADKPFYFKSTDAEKSLDKTIYKIITALRATTAAPGYLPAFKIKIKDKDGVVRDHAFLDGGLVNNNPALVGYVEAQKLAGSRPVRVLSLGTGEVDYKVSYARLAHAGFLAVAPVVFNAFFSAMEAHPGQILEDVLPKDDYFRFQLYNIDPKHAELDNVSSMSYLQSKTVEWIQDNDELLERICARIRPKLDPLDPHAKPIEYY
jgi:predicted acylesterase/phospholipase RssA